MVQVNWESVVTNDQYWRLLVAHYFHFSFGPLFVNCVSLMAMGKNISLFTL